MDPRGSARRSAPDPAPQGDLAVGYAGSLMEPGRDRAVVLVSGGMDSAVVAAMACRDAEAAFLHLDYGQITEARERRAFEAIADHYRAGRRLVARVDPLGKIGGTRLTGATKRVAGARAGAPFVPANQRSLPKPPL